MLIKHALFLLIFKYNSVNIKKKIQNNIECFFFIQKNPYTILVEKNAIEALH